MEGRLMHLSLFTLLLTVIGVVLASDADTSVVINIDATGVDATSLPLGPEDSAASAKDNTTRIVGGTWVKRGAHPYQAAMILNGTFNCGGTLLSKRHVLTAAHCLDIPGMKAEHIKIYLMTTTLSPLDANHIERSVSNYVIHKNYNSSAFEHDIGIMTLSKPVEGVRPVRLEGKDDKGKTYVGETGLVIGWGRTRQVLFPEVSSGLASNNLRQVNVTIIGAHDCKILYYDQYDFIKQEGRMCAVTLHGKGICQGDSGGPVFVNGVQVGVNSAAAGCADPRFPAVFTRVALYLDWIAENTK